MRVFSCSIGITALALSTALSLAFPLSHSTDQESGHNDIPNAATRRAIERTAGDPLLRRSGAHCANDPTVIAGRQVVKLVSWNSNGV